MIEKERGKFIVMPYGSSRLSGEGKETNKGVAWGSNP